MSWYRIKAVSDLLGMSTATLRAWERRYGVPAPARTAAAYRLYSDADVRVIQSMRDLVQGGVAPAEAARRVMGERALPPPDAGGDGEDPYAAARDRIVEAAARFDPDGLEIEVGRTLALGPAVAIFDRALGPALLRIGDLWHDGTITVAHEHVASQILGATLADLVRAAQPEGASLRAVLACFAGEEHCLALHGVALSLASWGFRTVMMGARTPPAALRRAIEALSPDLVALSVTMAPPLAEARALVDSYADACRQAAWIVGGQAALGMAGLIGAHGGVVAAGAMAEVRGQVDRAIAAKR